MIYAFYSYKGGVGRSTALAHVAKWLYLQGLRIVIVDWNLQSPGLESFFFAHVDDGAEREAAVSRDIAWIQDQVGVMDMLVDYQQSFGWLPSAAQPALKSTGNAELALRERMPPLAEYLVPIHADDGLDNAPGRGGSLHLLTAGRRSQEHFDSYAQTVADFSWDKLETGFCGKELIDSLRGELLKAADVILIDGPTGVGEVSSACTRRLADAVVCFCAPDDQNVEGTARMLAHFTSAKTLAAREHRPLEAIVVPARIDRSQPERVREFERRFARLIEQSPLAARLEARGFRHWNLQIPYLSELAFREQCIIGRERAGSPTTDRLEAAYLTLASYLAGLAPEGHALRRRLAARSAETSPVPHSPLAPAAPYTEFDDLKSALLEAAEMGHFVVEAPETRVTESVARPKEALGPRSPLAEPSVPPVASHTPDVRRKPRRWGWPVAGLSFLVLFTVLYLRARPLLELASGALGFAPPSIPEEKNQTPTDLGAANTTGSPAVQETPEPPALYLRIGIGPSCPKMLNYRKQFRAAGISDTEVAELRSGGCALVLGPYPADVVETRRKEHNARRIRGFGNAIVVDDRDFEKLL